MCGIFGMISKKPKAFNKRAFCTMGARNDSRGGDSCGVFIDGQVEYGVDKEKMFISFFRGSKVLNQVTECKVALGHCRKASIGKVSLETAQPVVLYNDSGAVDYVLIHNGTIHNYKELAKKYIPEIVGKVRYAEDCAVIMMIANGEKIQFWSDFIVWYEGGVGISNVNSDVWRKRLYEDNKRCFELIKDKHPEFGWIYDASFNKRKLIYYVYKIINKLVCIFNNDNIEIDLYEMNIDKEKLFKYLNL